MENKEVIEQLTETVRRLSNLLDKISDNHDRLFSTHGNQKAEISHIKEGLKGATDRITKIIAVLHEGNGQAPLVTRVAVLEARAAEGSVDIVRLYDKVQEVVTQSNLRASNDISSKKLTKELVIAVVSSIAAIIAAIAAST